jgi:hypothetical protein
MVAGKSLAWILSATAVAMACSPCVAATKELTPNGPWNAHFAENKCVLSGVFGEGEDKHVLALQQYWPSGSAGLTVAGRGFGKFENAQRTDLTFFNGQKAVEGRPFTGKVADIGAAVIYTSVFMGAPEQGPQERMRALPRLDSGFGQQVRYVSVKQGQREVKMLTGPLKAAFEVLNQCTEGLIAEWGLDLEQHKTATALPKWLNAETLTRRLQALYPQRALTLGEQGIMWIHRQSRRRGGRLRDPQGDQHAQTRFACLRGDETGGVRTRKRRVGPPVPFLLRDDDYLSDRLIVRVRPSRPS